MKILALDLGNRKTVACIYDSPTGEHCYRSVISEAGALHDLIIEIEPRRVVFEISPMAGWLADLVRTLDIELQVVNTTHEAWRWRQVKNKNDRIDALKLARLSAMNQLSLVHVPERSVRQWRSLISYRVQLISRRTAIKNGIRAILHREGLRMPAGRKGWNGESITRLEQLARDLQEVNQEDLWRGQLSMELQSLEAIEQALSQLNKKLDQLAEANTRCCLLMSIPGVGPRLSEMIVAVIDDPHRFKSGRQIGAYVGLTPRQHQSGDSNRQGRISRAGNQELRSMLVEVAWVGLQYNPWMRQVYENVRRGSPSRKKIAIVAVARRLLVCCWAILRDGEPWRQPAEVAA